MILTLFVLALIGAAISLYAFMTERKLKQDPSYKPACDISDHISCSKPLKSTYGNLFFVSNSVAGLIFYALMMYLALAHHSQLALIASIAGCLVSAVLAYILYFRIKSFCIVCTSLYVVNILLLYQSYLSL